MAQPIVIFDFERRTVTEVGAVGPVRKILAEALEAQRKTITTASGAPRPSTAK